VSPPEKTDTLVSRFTRVTGPLHARLYRIARSLCRDDDQAADLTQETLIRAFCAFDSFRAGEPVLPWLCRILRNVHLDSFKTGRARHELSRRELPGTPDDPYQDVASSSPDALRLLERQSLRSFLNAEIEALEPGQRLILLLCDVEEMSYQEAAEIAGVPVGTVRSRLARARERLRERLCAKPELSEIRRLFANRS
jgi:RNA polymerase sigma-70 factor (ECF subfamily)